MNQLPARGGVAGLFLWTLLLGTRPALAESIVLDATASGGTSASGTVDTTVRAGPDSKASKEQMEQARAYFEAGRRHYASSEYAEAIENFQKAYAIVLSPEILYNIGRCYEALGQEEDAIYNYEMYLRLYPDAEDAADVRHRITVLKDVTTVESSSSEGRASGSTSAAAAAAGTEDDEEEEGIGVEEERWYQGLRIGGELGVTVPVIGPWERALVPAYLAFHLPLKSWLYLNATGILGVGASKDDENDTDEVKGIVGLLVGLRFVLGLSDRFELFFKAAFNFTGLGREHKNRMTLFLGGQGAVGVTVKIISGWRFVLEAMTDAGVIFPGLADGVDAWGSRGLAKPTLATGGMVGMEYEF